MGVVIGFILTNFLILVKNMDALGKMAGGVEKLFEKGGVRRPSMQQRFVSSLKPPFSNKFRPKSIHLQEERVKMAIGWIDTFFVKVEKMSFFHLIGYLNKNYRRIGQKLNCEVIVSFLSKKSGIPTFGPRLLMSFTCT